MKSRSKIAFTPSAARCMHATVRIRGALLLSPVRLEGSKVTNNGQIGLLIDRAAGTTVAVQRSADLSRWEEWQTVTLGEAPITVTDTIAGVPARGFYRAVSQ